MFFYNYSQYTHYKHYTLHIHTQAYLTGPDVIYDDNLCSSVALIRNLGIKESCCGRILYTVFSVAHADFNTVAMIACCVARQNMCRYNTISCFLVIQQWFTGNVLGLETHSDMTNMMLCLVGGKFTSSAF